jgi:hypothetical protein
MESHRRFTPRATTLFRATLLGLGAVFVGGGFAYYRYYRSAFWGMTGVAVDQPVLFSHRHHASELRIDCRYCHDSVETSSFAGMPSTHTCLSCHSQLFTQTTMLEPVIASASRNEPLRWNRVNALPDHVYFNHSIHVAKGVACTTCHGDIGSMALTAKGTSLQMRWCIECHRNPEPRLDPGEQVFAPHPSEQLNASSAPEPKAPDVLNHAELAHLTNCSTCHR